MKVSGQLRALATLFQGKWPMAHNRQEAGRPQSQFGCGGEEKISSPCWKKKSKLLSHPAAAILIPFMSNSNENKMRISYFLLSHICSIQESIGIVEKTVLRF
jgi:hypothetical protein